MKIVKASNGKGEAVIAQEVKLNNREIYMLESYNKVMNKNIPVTLDGYNSVGRSNQIVKEIANNPEAFFKFISMQNNTSPFVLVRDIILSQSR